MIIVTGSIVGSAEHIDQRVAFGLDHVRRSRAEPGCLSHAMSPPGRPKGEYRSARHGGCLVSRDAENLLRLVFFEEWADRASLQGHFAVPASHAFVKAVTAFATEPPTMELYEAPPTGM